MQSHDIAICCCALAAAGAALAAVLWRSSNTPTNGGVAIRIGQKTRFIISTSGRPKSLRRYQILLQELLRLDLAYVPISSSSGKIDPQHYVWALRGMNCLGGAISKDIKHTIIPFLDEIDELAQEVQSVNTVINNGGKLSGYNTDAMGFRQAIIRGIVESKIKVKTAVVYGYGGVSSVVFHVLKELGMQVFVTGRRMEQARARAKEFGVGVFEGGSTPACDLFVNATPVTDTDLGLAINFLPALAGAKCAFDHEMPGRCLQEYCADHGIFHIPGTAMYYPQMSLQWELFLPNEAVGGRLPALLLEADERAGAAVT